MLLIFSYLLLAYALLNFFLEEPFRAADETARRTLAHRLVFTYIKTCDVHELGLWCH